MLARCVLERLPELLLTTALACLLCALVALPVRGAETEVGPMPVVDLHVDLSYQANYRARPFARGLGQFVAADLIEAGVVGVVLPLFVPHDVSPSGPRLEDLDHSYARVFEWLDNTPPYRWPGCYPESGQAVRTWLAFEGSAPLGERPDLVRWWVARGVRFFGLVHAQDNRLASSSTGASGGAVGLTALGRRLVRQIHALGGIVDVSHASSATLRDVVELARQARVPVVATHSDAAALAPHPRNLADAELALIASTGGVVGINFHSRFLARGRSATLHDVVEHIRHVVRVAGAEHVGIGSDFEGGIRPPPGLETVRGFRPLARALVAAGLSVEDVRGIMSGNALRLLCPSPPFEGSSAGLVHANGRHRGEARSWKTP
ncbi:MAG: membrane dipeptidase [Polyangiaceae bacterium]|nr:membrane dipeptidase [Polyangiaceae bacterium]